MTNGSLVLCKEINICGGAEISLLSLRFAVKQGVSEKLALYGFFYPERLGHNTIEISLVNKTRAKSTPLYFTDTLCVTKSHFQNGGVPLIMENVLIFIGDSDKYAIDLIVNGDIYASTTLNVVPINTNPDI